MVGVISDELDSAPLRCTRHAVRIRVYKVERLTASPIWRPAVFHMASLGLACASPWDAMWKTV